jgi:hypothetical protein
MYPVEYPNPVLFQLSPFSLYPIDKWIKPQNFEEQDACDRKQTKWKDLSTVREQLDY